MVDTCIKSGDQDPAGVGPVPGGQDEARLRAATDSQVHRFSQRNWITSGIYLGVVVDEVAARLCREDRPACWHITRLLLIF